MELCFSSLQVSTGHYQVLRGVACKLYRGLEGGNKENNVWVGKHCLRLALHVSLPPVLFRVIYTKLLVASSSQQA